jgi:hypothetical protein
MSLLWRVGFRFETAAQAEAAYTELDAESEIEAVGASLSLAGPVLYAYADSRTLIEQSIEIIRSRANDLSTKPESFTLDKWIADEGRWSLNHRGRATEDSGLADWLVDALAVVPFVRPGQ